MRVVEFKDVAEKFIKKTKSENLKWDINYKYRYWATDCHHDCRFAVYSNVQPQSEYSQTFDDNEISPLVDLLNIKFLMNLPTPNRALQVALECLDK